ncbi:pyridoxal 5'-phosphate synthase [Cellulomonas sp. HZM]|uniref:pyridoxine/pyridoxamine 5'-phosphate oxidase n=1 Tax=Cellulomonas sp. HZM TaxID=1454010 RepID=UPI000557411D|nr:pyridoxal 5'-phosphate synthase [Cellulomonas sp. HZM]
MSVDWEGLNARLARSAALVGEPGGLDPDAAPDDPMELFAHWFSDALDAVPEARAATLSTTGAGGPTARVLILRSVGPEGFAFATDARSAKVADLASDPRAALSFWWQPLVRQVRVTGTARWLGAEESARDFAARGAASRAAARASRPGEPLGSVDELHAAFEAAALDDGPLDDWQAWLLEPSTIEFWQGSADRAHVRLRYRRDGEWWEHGLRWP